MQIAAEVAQFTGKDSLFEEPEAPDLVIDTESLSVAEARRAVVDAIAPRIRLTD